MKIIFLRLERTLLIMLVIGVVFGCVNKSQLPKDNKLEAISNDNSDPKSKIQLSKKVTDYIEKTYGQNQKHKAAAIQWAKSDEMIISIGKIDGITREYVKHESDRSVSCVGFVFSSFNENDIRKFYPLIFDTPTKVRAWAKWNESWSGKMLGSFNGTEDEACDR